MPSSSNDVAKHAPTDQMMANAIRFLAADAVERAKSGHPGMPLGFADVATVLWRDFLHFDVTDPLWPNRDRLILSAGHGSMLLYAINYLTGYSAFPLETIKNFRRLNSLAAGHPEYDPSVGIETTTGPLGQGLANAVGIALAQHWLTNMYGDDCPLNHKTYAIVGDGCLMEGICEETISLAGHWKLKNLICLFDDNRITIDGATDLARSDDQCQRFALHNWNTMAVDGHDHAAIHDALAKTQNSDKPTFIAFRTQIGKGAPTKQGSAASHGSPLGETEIAEMRKALNWPHAPFEIPETILNKWRSTGTKHQAARKSWYQNLSDGQQQCLEVLDRKKWASTADKHLIAYAQTKVNNPKALASRISGQECLDAIAPHVPSLIGGSADLTGSNNTKAKTQDSFFAPDSKGSYLHYGVREHGMAAIMNGLCLYGLIPYGGTFLTFSDYMRPAIRLAALMELPNIFIFTHDSIGLGEDGPTHQPIEHLAALRAIPRLNIYRPGDSVETAECWRLALNSDGHPSALCLSRQALPALRTEYMVNHSAHGGYVLRSCDQPDIVLVGSGSETSLAVSAAEQLTAQGHKIRVVSMPCLDVWWRQPKSYRDNTLSSVPRIIIEAGLAQSWQGILREDDHFIGLNDFGASAPGPDMYQHCDITIDAIVQSALKLLAR